MIHPYPVNDGMTDDYDGTSVKLECVWKGSDMVKNIA